MTDEKQDEKGTQKPKTPQTPFGGWRNASTQSQNSEADKEPRAVITNEDGSQRPADEDDLNMPKYSGNEANSGDTAIKSFSATFGQVKEEPAPLPPVPGMWDEPEEQTPEPEQESSGGAFSFVSSGAAELVETNPTPSFTTEENGETPQDDPVEEAPAPEAETEATATTPATDDPFAWSPEEAPQPTDAPRRADTGGESWMQASTSYEELQSSTRAALEEAEKAANPQVEKVETTPTVNPYTFGKEEGWVAPPMEVDALDAEGEKPGFEFRAPEPEATAETEEQEAQPASPFDLSAFADDDTPQTSAPTDFVETDSQQTAESSTPEPEQEQATVPPIPAAEPEQYASAPEAEGSAPSVAPEDTSSSFAPDESAPEEAAPAADFMMTAPQSEEPAAQNEVPDTEAELQPTEEAPVTEAPVAEDATPPSPAGNTSGKTKFQAYKPAVVEEANMPDEFALNPQEAALLGAEENNPAAQEEAATADFMMAAPQPEAPAATQSFDETAPQENTTEETAVAEDAPVPAAAPEVADDVPAPDFMMAAPAAEETQVEDAQEPQATPHEEPATPESSVQDAPIPAEAPIQAEETPLPEAYAPPSEESTPLPEQQPDSTAWEQPAPAEEETAPVPEATPAPSFGFAEPTAEDTTPADTFPPVPEHPTQTEAYQSEMPHESGMGPVAADAPPAPDQWDAPPMAEPEAPVPPYDTAAEQPYEAPAAEEQGWQPETPSADFGAETAATAQDAPAEYHANMQEPPLQEEHPAEFFAQPTATSAPEQISHSPEDVQAILQDHITWLNSGGKEGRRANFRNANLQQYDLSNQQLAEASFRGANLYGVNFSGCDMRGADLSEAQLSASTFHSSGLAGTVFSRADLRGASFANSDLQGADFNSAFLGGATLAQLNLSSSVFLDADLQGTNLTQSSLISANLRGANLSYANLTAANLSGANCRDVRFDQAMLDNAVLEGANLKNTSLQGASLLGTDLSSAGDGSSEQRQDALQAEKEQIMQEWQRIKEYEGQIQHLQSSIQQREMALQTERVNTERSRRELRAQREVLETLIHTAQDVMSNHRKHDRRLKFYGVFWFMLTILAGVGMMLFISALDTAALGWMEIGMVIVACGLVLWLFIATTMRSIKLSNNLKQLLDAYEQHLPPSDQTGH